MYDIDLAIKREDWFYILVVGIVFGMLLSILAYVLLYKDWISGALFGVILGFSITLFSLLFITFMNKQILPNVQQRYWMLLAAFFSFLSGFLGTVVGTFFASSSGIDLLYIFGESLYLVAVAIGILTYFVGILLYRFVKMRNMKEHLDYEYVQSRLRSLERQLNPHFLFNALNSIAELIHQDVEKAEDALLRVSSFLRNSMDEKALLSIEDEMKNVEDYIALENIRFSAKIKLHVLSAKPKWCVPKFSIQLIVENAIKHGYIVNQELNIFVEFDTQKKVIMIHNDGHEMESRRFGVGLSNLNQRLALLCNAYVKVEDIHSSSFYIHVGECCENIDC